MTRKRIYELAKEWGVSSQAILAQLEKIGIAGKKAQSILTEEEAAQVKDRLGLALAPGPVIGEDRLVAERIVTEGDRDAVQAVAAKEQVVERRVRTDVIRRRTTRVEIPQQPAEPEEKPVQRGEKPVEVSRLSPEPSPLPPPMAFEQIPVEEALLPFSLPTVEDLPGLAAPVAGGQKEEQASPFVSQEPAQQRGVAPTFEAAEAVTTPSGTARSSRILGRIDLRKVTTVPVARPQPRHQQNRPEKPSQRVSQKVSPERTPLAAREQGVREKTAPQIGGREAAEHRPAKRKPGHLREINVVRAREERREREGRLSQASPRKKLPLGREQQKEPTVPKASKRVIRVAEVITVGELAKAIGVKAAEVIARLMGLGVLATINQAIDADTATLVAAEFGYTVENAAFDAETLLAETDGHAQLETVPRAPVVTVMGHVDHGKTSLLDAIRQANVTAREAGGITQHIGAYDVEVTGKKITFLDTPGHEAFTAMRARGAQVTDIVVLVVAADDGVMPQTLEAINHARAAHVPFVVALTKMDKPEANLERVKKELASYGVVPEEWGGDAIFVPVSAKTGEGISELLEMILLQAEVLELKAPLSPQARGTVIEARLDKGRGPVATVLVQAGRLKVGDPCVCGTQYGKVRALFDSRGQRMTEAAPATPVEILGLSGVPAAGDAFVVTRDEMQARQVAEHRQRTQREKALTSAKKFSLADFAQSEAEQKELRVILKADVQGSVEALSEAVRRLATEEVKPVILHASVGAISESDVLLATASHGIIIGFHVRPDAKAAKLAEREQVEIRLYNVIYEVLADVRAALEGLLAPTYREKALGHFEVRQVFTIPRVGVVAGGLVQEGKITRGAQVRLLRDHAVVYQNKVASLRRFKEDVREVTAGYECGVGLENFQDIKVGDVIQAFELEQISRQLDPKPREAELPLSA